MILIFAHKKEIQNNYILIAIFRSPKIKGKMHPNSAKSFQNLQVHMFNVEVFYSRKDQVKEMIS